MSQLHICIKMKTNTSEEPITKAAIKKRLFEIFGASGAAQVGEEAGVSRQSAHKWLTKENRNSPEIMKAAIKVIDRETKLLELREQLN